MNSDLHDQDQAHRQQALDATQSFIIQAPAGSGKTELLIQRLLTLLTTVSKPEEILAITFTKKAASEMRMRLIKALKQAQLPNEPSSQHAKMTYHLAQKVIERDSQLKWHLIQNPNQLRIQTIDSLCSFLTKQLPMLSHFGSQPDIADNPVSLYQEAVREVLQHLEEELAWSDAIATLLIHLDNDLNKLHELLIHLLQKRDQWLAYIHLDHPEVNIRSHLEKQLEAVIGDHLTKTLQSCPRILSTEILAIARFAADNLAIANAISPINACHQLTKLPGNKISDQALWQGLAKLLLTDEGQWRKQFNVNIGFPPASSVKHAEEKHLFDDYKQRAAQLVASLQNHPEFRSHLAELSSLPESRYQDSQWHVLQALFHVLKITAAQLRLSFQRHGQIDFIENTQAALLALGNDDKPTDLALALDYQIKHILIDEFQDTSFTQYQLIKKLTAGWLPEDGRTVFIVGDPMQSIYRFREAEVGLFIRLYANGMEQLDLTPLKLIKNFRSTPNIVDWNNEHFSMIFPRVSDIANGAVSYSPSISNTANDSLSSITIAGFIKESDASQANEIVKLIHERQLIAPNETIAILVRARTHLKYILPALKDANIAYRAIDIDPLADKQVIQDILSLISALINPSDRIAWLSMLRAPWCGLTLADLLTLSEGHSQTGLYQQLSQQKLPSSLSVDGRNRLARFTPIIQAKMADRDRYSLRYWIESTWLAIGGPASLSEAADIADVNTFFSLLDEYSQSIEPLNIDHLKIKMKSLYATSQHNEAAVQIMTIHSAKGLEFDTVILPHLERRPANDKSALLLWMEQPLANEQNALLLAPMHATGEDKNRIYQYISKQQKRKAEHEINRLLYVATTRAKNNLYLFFTTSQKDDASYQLEPGSLLKMLWPLFGKRVDTLIAHKEKHETNENIAPKPERLLNRLSSDWQHPLIYEASAAHSRHQKQTGFQLCETDLKEIGILSHRILQHLSKVGVEWWLACSLDESMQYISTKLVQANIPTSRIEQAAMQVNRIIHNALHDERGLWILKNHLEAQSEFALSVVAMDEVVENYIIDRTFVDNKNTRWIIDYKTTLNSQEELNVFLGKEREKYEDKMLKYAGAMRLLDNRSVRMGLYFPAVPGWVEWGEC